MQLEAFCHSCPKADEVTTFLQPFGFTLIFHMEAQPGREASLHLPAQYHYQDRHGTEVIFLAGKDRPDDDQIKYPQHNSRWWIYEGSDAESLQQVKRALAQRWFISWFSLNSHISQTSNTNKSSSSRIA